MKSYSYRNSGGTTRIDLESWTSQGSRSCSRRVFLAGRRVVCWHTWRQWKRPKKQLKYSRLSLSWRAKVIEECCTSNSRDKYHSRRKPLLEGLQRWWRVLYGSERRRGELQGRRFDLQRVEVEEKRWSYMSSNARLTTQTAENGLGDVETRTPNASNPSQFTRTSCSRNRTESEQASCRSRTQLTPSTRPL